MDEGRLAVDCRGGVALLPVVVVAPREHLVNNDYLRTGELQQDVLLAPPHLPGVGDGEAVERAHGHVDDLLAAEALHHRRLAHVLVGPVAQAEVVALAPRPHQAAPGERQRELRAALDLRDARPVQLLSKRMK